MGGSCSTDGNDDMHTIFWLENLKGRGHLEDLGVDVKVILEWILRKYGGKLWTGCMWLRIGTSSGLYLRQ
jgi:hypothetical protein